MSPERRTVLVLYHGGQHPSLTIFRDYISGIMAAYPDAGKIDYFSRYLELGAQAFETDILSEVRRHGSNLIYFLPGSGDLTVSAALLEQLAEEAVLVINFFDSELFFKRIDRYYAQAADLVLVPCPSSVPLFSTIGVKAHCTFSLFDPERYPCENSDLSVDVSFVGNLVKAGRRRYVDALQADGIRVELCGFGTAAGIVSHEQMVSLFNRSRINLNFTDAEEPGLLMYADTRATPVRQLKGRVTEIALTGGFVLTEYAPGLEEMYEIGREIAVFHDAGELADKIRWYLVHESERTSIAEAGRLRALRDYDCRTAFGHIEALLPEQSGRKRINCDEQFIHDQANYLFYYAVRFVLACRFIRALGEIRYICSLTSPDIRQAARLAVRAVAVCLRRHRLLSWCYDRVKSVLMLMMKDKSGQLDRKNDA